MKTALLLAAYLIASVSSVATAQLSTREGDQYREYEVRITTATGETKLISLEVDAKTYDYSYGDPEIPGHGFYESSVKGKIYEDGKSCDFSSLYSQSDSDGDMKKYNTTVTLCSGLSLEIKSSDALLENKDAKADVLAKGLKKSIGSAAIKFTGLKTIEAIDYDKY